MKQQSVTQAFINCHTHVFTGDHVPPYLGKKMLPGPIGYILTIPLVVNFFRWWYYKVKPLYFGRTARRLRKRYYEAGLWLHRYKAISLLLKLAGIILTIDALLIIIAWGGGFFSYETQFRGVTALFYRWHLLPYSPLLQYGIIVLVLLIIPSGRNLVWFVASRTLRLLKLLPGPKTRQYLIRYMSIGRFAFYRKQHNIFHTLTRQYPLRTRFVILPMDMDHMDAGQPRSNYMQQLAELKKLRRNNPDTALPFVFADPRRIAADPGYMQTIRECIEKEHFRGIKTYPALGYYPFDKDLLPLMLYACEHEIPVLNHCIRGVIFYRGEKKKEWNYHPVFSQATDDDKLQLFQKKNVDFSTNFTHPLNYLCLLDEKRLRQLLIHYNDPALFSLFGFRDAGTPLEKDLSRLKICFGHFGGEDEWLRYLESDRDLRNNNLQFHPDRGLNFSEDSALEGIWRYASWFGIIYSLMLQYPNVYADISYILHDARTHPLLKTTLLPQSGIADRVLFGTDFYVVRNQLSDKQIWTNMVAALSPEELTQMAVLNPRRFLFNRIHGEVDQA